MTAEHTPAEPTAEQCSTKARVEIPGRDVRAHAVWWPQMGGYSGKAVVTVTDCSTLWLWHDDSFPFSGDKRPPREIHLCDPQQWIELFEWLQAEVDVELNEVPEPYILRLPQGVTREEAEQVHTKILEWGMWEPDPGGFVIRTYEEWTAPKPCLPIPCPGSDPWIPEEQARATQEEVRRIAFRVPLEGGAIFAPDAKITGASVISSQVNADGSATAICDFKPVDLPQLKWFEESTLLHSSLDSHFTAHADGRIERDPGAPPWFELTPEAMEEALADPRWSRPRWLNTELAAAVHESGLTDRASGDHVPLIVGLPEGEDPVEAARAIQTCQRLGLLPDAPAGILFMPEGMELPEEG